MKIWKRLLALCLSALMVFALVACGDSAATEPPTEPEETQTPEEAAVLKVLTLGHSLAVDCGHMLALIADAEGYENMMVGTLYYSGCSLSRHVQHLQADKDAYSLYISSTERAKEPPRVLENVTMQEALHYDYWDIIVMQGGVFEIARESTYTSGNIQIIQNYVLDNTERPAPIFAWHMPWAPPTDNTLRDTFPYDNNSYYTNYVEYGDDRTTLYNAITRCVSDRIMTDDTFAFMIPSGTAIENALSSYLEEKDLHRDYVHASDLGRVIAAYTWYCRLVGIDQLEEIKLKTIPMEFLKSTHSFRDLPLTELELKVILESVNNALANPLQMTQSQYTQKG